MNYYERHLGDYARDTGHLSLLEHGAYTLLLDRYYATEAPIPADQVHRLARARTKEEIKAVDDVLKEFFTLTDGAWSHDRCETEIAKKESKAKAARENGRNGGRPKKPTLGSKNETQEKPSGFSLGSENVTQEKPKEKLTRHQTPVTSNHKHPQTPKGAEDGCENPENQNPSNPFAQKCPQTAQNGPRMQNQGAVDTEVAMGHENGPEARKTKTSSCAVEKPDDVPEQVWIDWVALRKSKKAPVTATAMEQARREAGKAEMSLADFLRIWCARGSQGLQADWIKTNERPQATRLQETFRERDQRMARERFEEAIGRRVTPSNVVNIAPAAAPFLEIAQ